MTAAPHKKRPWQIHPATHARRADFNARPVMLAAHASSIASVLSKNRQKSPLDLMEGIA